MPAIVAQFKAVSKPLQVTYEGLTISFHYSPGKYTPNFETVLNADEARGGRFLLSFLTELISDWDITANDQGTKAEINVATLSGLSYSFLNKVATEIIKDLSAGETSAPEDGYLLFRAARYLGVSPRELSKHSIAWIGWALISEYEENRAKVEAQKRAITDAERRNRYNFRAPI